MQLLKFYLDLCESCFLAFYFLSYKECFCLNFIAILYFILQQYQQSKINKIMTFINKLIYLKNICCPCLVQTELQKSHYQKQSPLIQLNQISKYQNSIKQLFPRQKSNDVSTTQINFYEVKPQINKMTKSLKQTKRTSLKIQHQISKNQNADILQQSRSDSSFHTVKSSLSRPISRRQFKLLKTSSLLRNSKKKNQDQFYSINESDDTNFKANIIKFTDQFGQNPSQSIKNLIKKEYQKLQQLPKINVNQIMKLKIQSNDNFDSLVHKIEDYYTFYYDFQQQDCNLTQSQVYIGKNNTFIGSFNKTQNNKAFDNQRACKYMSLCVIQHINVTPLKFIQWFNQHQIQGIFHNFNRIEYAQIDEIYEELPILIVEQFGQHLLGKSKFNLIKQIEAVKFQNQDQASLLEIDYQISGQMKYFQRLIRIDSQQNGKVQIYTQSSQNIKDNQQKYFKNLWILFEERLYKDKIIKSQFKYYVN